MFCRPTGTIDPAGGPLLSIFQPIVERPSLIVPDAPEAPCAGASASARRKSTFFDLLLGRLPPAVSAALLGATFSTLDTISAHAQPITYEAGVAVSIQAQLIQTLTLRARVVRYDELGRETLVALVKSPGFAGLAIDQQRRMLALAGGTNNEYSQNATVQLRVVIKDANYLAAQPAEQTRALTRFLIDPPYLNPVAAASARAFSEEAPYSLSAASDAGVVDFRSGRAQGVRYHVTFANQTIPVYMPAANVAVLGSLPSIDDIAHALARLPEANRRLVGSVYANPGHNPEDVGLSNSRGVPFLSYMTADDRGVVSIYTLMGPTVSRNLDHSLIHETGHILSFRTFGRSYDDRRWNEWKVAIRSDALRPTEYAKSSPGEDFSETLVFYVSSRNDPLAHAELRALFPARFRILDRLLR